MTTAEYRALGTQKSPPTPRTARHPTKDTDTPREPGKSKEKEPTEKHAQLPPAPVVVGPWAVGHWTVSRATTYEPRARVVLTGPADEFEQLLAHLQQFQP